MKATLSNKVSLKHKISSLFRKKVAPIPEASESSKETEYSPCTLEESPKLTLNIRSTYRDMAKCTENPFLEKVSTYSAGKCECEKTSQAQPRTIKKTGSIRDLKAKYNALKRSSSMKFSSNHKVKTNIKKSDNIKLQTSPHNTTRFTPQQDYDTEIEDFSTSSIFENSMTVSHISSFQDITPTNESYTDIYNNIFGNYYARNQFSVESSIISDKENVPPSQYLLSASHTPNYSITTQTPKLLCTPIFEKRMEQGSHNCVHDYELQNRFISNLIEKSPFEENEYNVDPFHFHPPEAQILPSPKPVAPKHKLPKIPQPQLNTRSPASPKYFHTYNELLREPNLDDMSNEERSLFDALSNVEWWDCSRVTLRQIEDSKI
jgi:hypothetical protein